MAVKGSRRSAPALLSVVVPCFNEEAVVVETHRRLTAALDDLEGFEFEVVYVDDGSDDATLDLLRDVQKNDSRVRVVSLSRNFGHQVSSSPACARRWATRLPSSTRTCRIRRTSWRRWLRAGATAWTSPTARRTERAGESRLKLGLAWTFYRLLAKVSDTPIPLDAGDFRLVDRRVVDALLSMPERDLLLRGMVAWTGFRQEAVPFLRAPKARRQDEVSAVEDAAPGRGRHSVLLAAAAANRDLDRLAGGWRGRGRNRLCAHGAPVHWRLTSAGLRCSSPSFHRRRADDAPGSARRVRGTHLRRSEAAAAVFREGTPWVSATAGKRAGWPPQDAPTPRGSMSAYWRDAGP